MKHPDAGTVTVTDRPARATAADGSEDPAVARLMSSAREVAVAIIAAARNERGAQGQPTPRRAGSRYADGYFSGLCFAIGVLQDRPAGLIAAQLLEGNQRSER
jgi:hypothetical protein